MSQGSEKRTNHARDMPLPMKECVELINFKEFQSGIFKKRKKPSERLDFLRLLASSPPVIDSH